MDMMATLQEQLADLTARVTGQRPPQPMDPKAHDRNAARLREMEAEKEKEGARLYREDARLAKEEEKAREALEAVQRRRHAVQVQRSSLDARYAREERQLRRQLEAEAVPVIEETRAELDAMIEAHQPKPATRKGGRDLNGNEVITHTDTASRRQRIAYLLEARRDLNTRIRFLKAKEIPAACRDLLDGVPELRMERVR